MKKVDYNPESHLLPEIVLKYHEDILKIYQAIYTQSRRSKPFKGQKTEKLQSSQNGSEKKINSSR